MYEYKMVQIPMKLPRGGNTPDAASYVQSVVDEWTSQGWEYLRVEEIGETIKPGCLASLFGFRSFMNFFYVISFRKQK